MVDFTSSLKLFIQFYSENTNQSEGDLSSTYLIIQFSLHWLHSGLKATFDNDAECVGSEIHQGIQMKLSLSIRSYFLVCSQDINKQTK